MDFMMQHHIKATSDTIMGNVASIDLKKVSFELSCNSGDTYEVLIKPETQFSTLTNIDNEDRDRIPLPPSFTLFNPTELLRKYIKKDNLVFVEGIEQEVSGGTKMFKATVVHNLYAGNIVEPTKRGRFLFEESNWWVDQIRVLGIEWLYDLFKDKRTYTPDNFA